MHQTIVGVFDNMEQAQRAVAALTAQGVSRDQVELTESSSVDGAATGTAATGARDRADDGVLTHVKHFFENLFGDDDADAADYAEHVRRGGALVKVEVDDDQLDLAARALDDAGAVDIDERASEWRGEAATGDTSGVLSSADAGTTRRDALDAGARDEGSDVIPVVKEELEVGKRTIGTGGLRVYSRTVSTPVNESVELRSERAQVQRRPVDRPATEADLSALKDRSIEVRETAEKAVVNKRARVVEEVSVGKTVETRREQVNDELRHTEVEVERLGEGQGDREVAARRDLDDAAVTGRGAMGDAGALAAWRSDFDRNYATSGANWTDYQPAYQYGSTLRSDARYRDRDWDAIESDARRDWETRYPGTAWEKVKAAVRHAWERVTD